MTPGCVPMEPRESLQVLERPCGLLRRATGADRCRNVRTAGVEGPVRVLVVDDDRDVREVIISALEREHFELRQAADGRSAVDLAQSFQPDVILLDLNLPELSGIDVCQRVRRSPTRTS